MTITCWPPGCKSGYNRQNGVRHFFSVPKDDARRLLWSRKIPRQGVLTSKHYLCDIHFDERYIVKTHDVTVNGETTRVPRGKWDLTLDAVPTIFPNLPHYLSTELPKKDVF